MRAEGASTAGSPAAAATSDQRFAYKPALDGLRAVAVGSVIAFHFGAGWAPGGFLGVDTFFVLSGYLITSLLVSEWGRTGTLRFSAFWARRARRLLPALCLMLGAIALWAYSTAQTDTLTALRADSLSTLFYGANWHFIASGQSYFNLFRAPSPLRHTWSLAIEEQFYLLWPLLTFALLRVGRGRSKLLGWFCAAGIAASTFWLAHLYSPSDPSRAYYGTDTRASQLLVGALLAIVLLRWSPRTTAAKARLQLAGLAGAAGCVWAFASAHDRDSWLYHGGFLLFALATAAVIASCAHSERTPLARILSLKPVRWIGAISYGLYLWHWPVVVVVTHANTKLHGIELGLVRLAITLGAATLSYYFVEIPIRRGEVFRSWRARVAVPVGLAAMAAVVFGATAPATEPPAYLVAPKSRVLAGGPPSTVTPTTTPAAATPLPTTWLLVGDSVATSVAPAFQAEAAREGITAYSRTRPGCGMITAPPVNPDGTAVSWGPRCADSAASYESQAVQATDPQLVLWMSGWEALDHVFNGQVLQLGTPAGDAALVAEIEAAVDRLTAGGARVVLLTNPPRSPDNDVGLPASDDDVRRINHLNELYTQVAAARPNTVIIADIDPIVCPGGAPCPGWIDGVHLRPYDGSHFDGAGAAWLAPKLIEAVRVALLRAPSPGTRSY